MKSGFWLVIVTLFLAFVVVASGCDRQPQTEKNLLTTTLNEYFCS